LGVLYIKNKKVGSVTKTTEQRIAIFKILENRKGTILYEELVACLSGLGHDRISAQEFGLWRSFYYPAVSDAPYLYNGIVLEGRGLSWLARNLITRRKRMGMS
jgi:hypothetical protein